MASRQARCHRCRSTDTIIDKSAGDVVCRDCGEVVLDRMIDNSNEERSFCDDDSNKKRESRTSGLPEGCSSNETFFIGGGPRVDGGYCSVLNRCMHMAETAEEQTMTNLARRIREISSSLNVSKRIMTIAEDMVRRLTKTTASSLYHLTASGCMKNANLQPVAAAAVYLACRQDGYGRTLEEVSLVSDAEKSAITRAQSTITRELNLRVSRVMPADLVGRIATQARLSPLVCLSARHICQTAAKYGLMDTLVPQLVAGSSLILAALAGGEELDLGKIAKATISCTTLQLRKGYEQLFPHAAFLLSDDAKHCLGGDLSLLPPKVPKCPEGGVIPPLPGAKVLSALSGRVTFDSESGPDPAAKANCLKRSIPFNVAAAAVAASVPSHTITARNVKSRPNPP